MQVPLAQASTEAQENLKIDHPNENSLPFLTEKQLGEQEFSFQPFNAFDDFSYDYSPYPIKQQQTLPETLPAVKQQWSSILNATPSTETETVAQNALPITV